MSGKIVINGIEFKKDELIRACFGISDGYLIDTFTLERTPSDKKIKNLIESNSIFEVEYFDKDNQLFGILTEGRYCDYKIEPTLERLQLSGIVKLIDM